MGFSPSASSTKTTPSALSVLWHAVFCSFAPEWKNFHTWVSRQGPAFGFYPFLCQWQIWAQHYTHTAPIFFSPSFLFFLWFPMLQSLKPNYSWFLLFMVVTFYKVVANTKLASTEALLLGDTQDWVPVSLHLAFSSTDQYVALFYECFCLKTPYFMYVCVCTCV